MRIVRREEAVRGEQAASGERPQEAAGSPRLVELCLRFGVPLVGPGLPSRTLGGLGLSFAPGTLTLVCGPSGAGKSLLLKEIARTWPTARVVNEAEFPTDVAVVDAIAPARPIAEALELMTACGLGEPRLWLRRFDQLSEGERFRARLARAIWLHRRDGTAGPLLCDEFGSMLHRRLAKAVAFNLRRLVTRERLALVVATGHEDLAGDLGPDRVVRLPDRQDAGTTSHQRGAGTTPHGQDARATRSERESGRTGEREKGGAGTADGRSGSDALPALALRSRLRIESGTVRDYQAFAGMHYRERDQLGFVDKIFVMRDGADGEPLGIVVYGHPVLELALRNRVTGGRFRGNAARLNREMRVLKRLVIHPDVRGCGLGRWLVERTLPMAGVRFVECLAAMGAVHPVFDRAGMRRVGECAPPASRDATVAKLRAMGADPLAADFVAQVCRRPAVRKLVAAAVAEWYRSTTGGGEVRVARQTPTVLARTFRQLAGSEPVYFIWARDEEAWGELEGARGEGLGTRVEGNAKT